MTPNASNRLMLLVFLILLGFFLFSTAAQAADLFVDCNGGPKAKIKSITAALGQLPKGANTIHVSGTCTENISIINIDRLTLVGNPTAILNDASGDTLPVIYIGDSDHIVVQNFTVNGGFLCVEFSTCNFANDTFQGGSGGSGYGRSAGRIENTTFQDTGGDGLVVYNSTVTIDANTKIQGNQGSGVLLRFGGVLTAWGGTIQNNVRHGVWVMENSILRTAGGSITGNGGNGVNLDSGGFALIRPEVIINTNAGDGVSVGDLSMVRFPGATTISGNLGGMKVRCLEKYSATRGVANVANINLGETNCTEP